MFENITDNYPRRWVFDIPLSKGFIEGFENKFSNIILSKLFYIGIFTCIIKKSLPVIRIEYSFIIILENILG